MRQRNREIERPTSLYTLTFFFQIKPLFWESSPALYFKVLVLGRDFVLRNPTRPYDLTFFSVSCLSDNAVCHRWGVFQLFRFFFISTWTNSVKERMYSHFFLQITFLPSCQQGHGGSPHNRQRNSHPYRVTASDTPTGTATGLLRQVKTLCINVRTGRVL